MLSRHLLVVLPLASATALSACGSNGPSTPDTRGAPVPSGSSAPEGVGPSIVLPPTPSAATGVLLVTPSDLVVTIHNGQAAMPVNYAVHDQGSGERFQHVKWRLSRPELGAIGTDSGVFVANGKVGAQAEVIAEVGDKRGTARVIVKLVTEQNGGSDSAPDTGGGRGGVGGPGVGGPVSAELKAALDSAPRLDPYTKWLYPYDGTVFPVGILSPLLQWSEGLGAIADGIRIRVESEHLSYTGYFARPASLSADASFLAHPFPKDMWESATLSAAGGTLSVELTVAAKGKAYGPLKQVWRIAPGKLRGTVYYQTYGTQGIINDPTKQLGGAVLAIRPGEASPKVVAGASGGEDQCRVCHSVSSNGNRLIVGHGGWKPYRGSSAYKLNAGNEEVNYGQAPRENLNLFWSAPYPDGSIVLGSAKDHDWEGLTDLWEVDTQRKLDHRGLYDFVTEALLPAFSHDGKRVAFTFKGGPGVATNGVAKPGDLVVMDFDKARTTFSRPRIVYASEPNRPAQWSTFAPDGRSVVFQVLLQKDSYYGNSIASVRGELWWSNIEESAPHRLDLANGVRDGEVYLPVGPTYHPNDAEVNFEPTVSPIASGGFAWMVFASRRLYGHVIGDDVEPKIQKVDKPHPRKLWVAALDLLPKVGTDPSHPPFYLPGQELRALNSRGYWVNSPCLAQGASCEVGIDCCDGTCLDNGAGRLQCGDKLGTCSREFERCSNDQDCCVQDPRLACVNHVCTNVDPPPVK